MTVPPDPDSNKTPPLHEAFSYERLVSLLWNDGELAYHQAQEKAHVVLDALKPYIHAVGHARTIVDAELAEPWDEYSEGLARRVRRALAGDS